ncbi:prepilin peptidase [Marinobacterium jannaschii]|uniref:prepilin peptidase n=1 Tax=Marinobacterium jannaschii TaxID=64970 RepID=UPI0004820C6C|nr:A24 family peptidase [Marinobacterium jannaschii]
MYFEFLLNNLWLAISLSTIFALLIGSFLNVVIHRIPVMMQREWQAQLDDTDASQQTPYNLIVPGSSCPHCQHSIRWYENIPLFSYLMQKGRCNGCKTSISIRYPIVELISALLVGFIVYTYGLNEISITLTLLTWALICLTAIDIDHQLLPDRITLPLLWLGLLANSYGLFTTLHLAVFGAVAGYLSLWSIFWLFKLVTGKEGMGYGDFKLLAALGAWAGIDQLPLIILLSSVVGAAIGIAMILFQRHDQQKPIPFGPYLAIAGWIAMIWGQDITQAYFRYIGL